jgi:PKD repeat protein
MKRLLPLLIFTFLICVHKPGKAQCSAGFTASNTICINGTVTFTDMALGSGAADSIVKEIWIWGDGKIDTAYSAHNLTHNYFLNGIYTVSQSIFTKSNCTSIFTYTISVKVKPQVSYTFSPILTYCGFDSVLFYNQSATSTGEPLSLLWRFYDDGSTGTANIQSHRFYTQGVFWTSLRVTAQNGCVDSLRKQIATMAPTKASFTVAPLQCAGDSVVITETSYMASPSNFYSKTWFFGDGTSRTDYNLTNKTIKHRYATAGKYIVTLRYETSNCLQYYSDSFQVAQAPLPAFTTTAETVGLCGMQAIEFNNTSTSPFPGDLAYEWIFSDGTITNTINPIFYYPANGTYAVSLKVTPAVGCSAKLDTSIVISAVLPKPRAWFRFATDSLNLLKFNFYDSSSVDLPSVLSNYTWNFGDGTGSTITTQNTISHAYSAKGTYTVQCTVKASDSCSTTTSKIVIADSTPVTLCTPYFTASTSVCIGAATSISDYTPNNGSDSVLKEIWQYGDGIADTVTAGFVLNRSHTYAAPGIYYITLTMFSKSGCSGSRTVKTTVRNNKVKADFTYQQLPVCNSTTKQVQFSVILPTYYGTLVSRLYFGDDIYDYSEEINPLHAYPSPGTYTVKLLTRISACSSVYDTLVKTIQVLPQTSAGIFYKVDEANPKTVHFLDQSISGFNSITGWSWDFGDGVTSVEQNPAHTFSSYGAFSVSHSFLSELISCKTDTAVMEIHLDSFVTSPASSQSSMGKDFWAGFGYIENMKRRVASSSSIPAMSVYLSAGANAATVVVDIPAMAASKKNAVGFPKIIYVPPFSNVEVTGFPIGDANDPFNANDATDSRLYFTGVTNRGIHITSNQPVGAWLHIYSTNNTAGGTLLLPTNVWGNTYFVQAMGGRSNNGNPNSYFFVVAEADSTLIEFTPAADIIDSSAATIFTDNHTIDHVLYKAGNTYTKMLNKGEVFNAMGFIAGAGSNTANGVDLSGTKIASIDPLKKIGVFGGNGRVLINTQLCLTITGSDNLVQQMFPKTVWGTKYLTTPTKTMEYGIYRITVDDMSTTVSVNGVPLSKSGLRNGHYYQIENNRPNLIESNKRIMVTQYVVSPACPDTSFGNNGQGDPEMINLSPVKYATNNVRVFSPPFKSPPASSASYVNVVIPKDAVSSFKVDFANMADTGTSSFRSAGLYGSSGLIPVENAFKQHPGDSNYYYAKIKVTTGVAHTLSANSPFTAIAYGMTGGESIGYNIGFKFNIQEFRYEYLGEGNWTDQVNWLGNRIPPNPLPMGSEVVISGHCLLNTPQTIEDGARVIVESGGSLVINGNLTIDN